MIKFKIKELIAQKEFDEKRIVNIAEICEETGIGRTTLSAIVNNKGKNVGIDNIDKLCAFFDCSIEQLIEYIPD